jgi:hypothetical protein
MAITAHQGAMFALFTAAALTWVFGAYHLIKFNAECARARSLGMIPRQCNLRMAIFWSNLVPSAESHRRNALWAGAALCGIVAFGFVSVDPSPRPSPKEGDHSAARALVTLVQRSPLPMGEG